MSGRIFVVKKKKGFTKNDISVADPGFFKMGGGGVHLRSTSKKGRSRRRPTLVPMLKCLQRGQKKGCPDPLDPHPLYPSMCFTTIIELLNFRKEYICTVLMGRIVGTNERPNDL